MNTKNTNWSTLIPSLLFAFNAAAMQFGVYHLSSGQLNSLDKLVSVFIMFIGIFLSHQKTGTTSVTVTPAPAPVPLTQPPEPATANPVQSNLTPDTTGHAPASISQ